MSNSSLTMIFRDEEAESSSETAVAASGDFLVDEFEPSFGQHQPFVEAKHVASLFFAFSLIAVPTVLLALLSNGLGFLVFYKKPAFRKILSNRLVMNLMTINIVSCLVLFPAVILDLSWSASEAVDFPQPVNNSSMTSLTTTFPMGVCIWSTLVSSLVAHASLLAMMTVGVDQYLAVLDPLEYNAKVARGVSWKLILLVWTLGFSAAVATSTQLVSAGERSPWTSCREVMASDEAYLGWKWLVITSSAFFVAPVLILTCIYLRIFAAASKSSRGIRRNSFHQPLTKAVEEEEEEGDEEEDDEAGAIAESSQQQQHKQEKDKEEHQQDSSSSVADCNQKASVQKERIISSPTACNSAPDLLSPSTEDKKGLGLEEDTFCSHNEEYRDTAVNHLAKRRAPKLSALRNQSTFSKTISADVSRERPQVSRQMSHQERRSLMTPKRKCSFSSFSEYRYVADGGKTRTFLFSLEAPSPTSPVKDSSDPDAGESEVSAFMASSKRSKYRSSDMASSVDWSSRETDQSIFASAWTSSRSPSKNNGIDVVTNPMFILGGSETVSRNSSPSPTPSHKFPTRRDSNASVGGEANGGAKNHVESTVPMNNLHKAGSLISMTSQAARRLSMNMSRRASSVCQFFQYKEELRTAKISALVLVIAFLCWGPFFLNLVILASLDDSHLSRRIIFWLHHTANFMMLLFAAVSPYVYVFRSSKVQKCLGQVIRDTFCLLGGCCLCCCCCISNQRKRWRRANHSNKNSLKNSHRHSIASSMVVANKEVEAEKLCHSSRHRLERGRSCSCPNISEDKEPPASFDREPSPCQKFVESLHQTAPVFVRPPPPVIVYTSSNLDVYNAVIYEEDGELIPPDEDALSHRRLSASLPYGLNLVIGQPIDAPTLESTV